MEPRLETAAAEASPVWRAQVLIDAVLQSPFHWHQEMLAEASWTCWKLLQLPLFIHQSSHAQHGLEHAAKNEQCASLTGKAPDMLHSARPCLDTSYHPVCLPTASTERSCLNAAHPGLLLLTTQRTCPGRTSLSQPRAGGESHSAPLSRAARGFNPRLAVTWATQGPPRASGPTPREPAVAAHPT